MGPGGEVGPGSTRTFNQSSARRLPYISFTLKAGFLGLQSDEFLVYSEGGDTRVICAHQVNGFKMF